MTETNATKVSSSQTARGTDGEVTLARGARSAMRMWKDEAPGEPKPATKRAYETLGYVVSGKAELHIEGRTVALEAGDSYVVPEGESHTYKILETFSAVETTTPAPR